MAKGKQLPKFAKETLKKVDGCRVAVTLDWLSVLYTDNGGRIPEPENGGVYQVTDKITLVFTGKGTEHFKYLYHVHYMGEHLASIVCYTRNEKFMKAGVVKVDFKNHLLYTNALWPFYDELVGVFGLEYRNISRVDIAMDGMNHLIGFLNGYVKQDSETKRVELKGRPRFNSKVLDRRTMYYQNFQIGVGSKTITVYNKSLDIVKTGKDYIQKFWENNGMMNEQMPLDDLGKTVNDDTAYIDGYENVYRFELRMKGETIKEIRNFNIELLRTVPGMIAVIRLMTRNFFEFVLLNDENLTRCNSIDVIPFDRFEFIPLEKAERQERDDLYKTKLSIKKNVKQLYTGKHTPDDAMVRQMLMFDIENFKLYEWFKKKLIREWQNEFSQLSADAGHVVLVDGLMIGILQECADKAGQTEAGQRKEDNFSMDDWALPSEVPLSFLRKRKRNIRHEIFMRRLNKLGLTGNEFDDLFK